jgi:nucleotide-binding universal stress UspA family protein
MSADRLPEVHQAMVSEARTRLARLIPLEDQDRLGIEIAIRTGPADEELVRYAAENPIDLAIVKAAPAKEEEAETARALLDHARCAVLVLR